MKSQNTENSPKQRPDKAMQQADSEHYLKRKRFFNSLLTVFGRLSVLEALQTDGIEAYKLHLSSRNKAAPILDEIQALAEQKGAEIVFHDKAALSRISKNAKQDQGVALDIKPAGFEELEPDTTFTQSAAEGAEYIALDHITNPQNVGMIIRSVCASPIKALILPRKGCAKLDALVIKASAGTLFRAPIMRCDKIGDALISASRAGVDIIGLDLKATKTLADISQAPHSGQARQSKIFVLGNESDGISAETKKLCTSKVKIPMHNRVESLNVAVTASLIALRHQL